MLAPWLSVRFEMLTSRLRAGPGAGRARHPGPRRAGRVLERRGGRAEPRADLDTLRRADHGLRHQPRADAARDGGSVSITLAYTLGTSIPMLGVMLGGRALLNKVPALTRNAGNIQKGFGVLMIVVGVAIGRAGTASSRASSARCRDTAPGSTAIERPPPSSRR